MTHAEMPHRNRMSTQKVLRCYLEAAQQVVGSKKGLSKEGSPAVLCARLAQAMREGRINDPFVAW